MLKHREVALFPSFPKSLESRLLTRGQYPLHVIQQRALLHPASCEGIKRKHRLNARMVRCLGFPLLQLCLEVRTIAWWSKLVQQQDDWLSQPLQNLHLDIDVPSRRWLLASVRHIQDDVARLACVAHCLLSAPERPVGNTIPDL